MTGEYPFYDVDFAVCDDGFTDSCRHRNWPKDCYGVYHNPYTPY